MPIHEKNYNIQEIYNSLEYTPVTSIDERDRFKFKSLFHFIHNVEYRYNRGIRHAEFSKSMPTYDEKGSGRFHSHESFESALKEAKTKKQPPSEVVELIKNKNRSKLTMTDLGGDGVDIPSYLSGSPDHFVKWNRETINSKTHEDRKTVFISIAANCGVNSSELEAYLNRVILEVYKKYRKCKIVLYAHSLVDGYNSVDEYNWSLFIDIPTAEVETLFRATYTDFFRRLVIYMQNQDSEMERSLGAAVRSEDIEKNKDGVVYTIS